jgi:glycosyltransferase involved in cell wall biosynthesis
MAERVAQSSLLGDRPVHYIPNAFPTDQLRPTNKLVARMRLGLPINKKLVLFGAANLGNKRKGGNLLKSAFERLRQRNRLADLEVVAFGSNAIGVPVRGHRLGNIDDPQHIARVYSAVDAFLLPSLEDNAPLTVGESLLCGTPVVAFPVGNVPEILHHKVNGYIARYLDFADFAEGIEWALDADAEMAIVRSMRCRSRGAEFHDPRIAAERHQAVYASVMREAS